MDWRGILLLIVVILLFLPLVSAEKHMKLLAVEEGPNGTKGNLADLYLKRVEGTGDVYVATSPLTRIDTQISARFAKDVACETIDNDCFSDFLYTIKAKSNLIGGPSAGAAIAILTISELQDIELDEKVAITGTINSGGLIGPVGSLTKKIEAAKEGNITTVLIAKGSRYAENSSKQEKEIEIMDIINITTDNSIDLVDFGRDLNISVIEVSRLEEALSYFTHELYEPEDVELEIDPEYEKTMLMLAESLCDRSVLLKGVIIEKGKVEGNEDIIESATNTTEQAFEFIEDGNYYSAASFCFAANVKYRTILYHDLEPRDFLDEAEEIAKVVLSGDNYQSKRNLQTYIIVKQRLSERDKLVDDAVGIFREYKVGRATLEDAQDLLAFARERLHSALAWSAFFKVGDQEDGISKEDMKDTCSKKLEEAQERFQYASIYYPIPQGETEKEIIRAMQDAENNDYELCIARATKAKAESDVILSVIGVKKEQLPTIIKEKLAVARNQIATQSSFPIVAYSYYQYSKSLIEEEDYYSALLYAEYALEMSNLDVYFNKPKMKIKFREEYLMRIFSLAVGIGIGASAFALAYTIRHRKPKARKKRSSKKPGKRRPKRR